MAAQRQLLRVLREIDNRLCADCEVALGNGKCYFSFEFGVWICSRCFELHSKLGIRGQYKSSQDQWSATEVDCAVATNNIQQNKLLERYLLPRWDKITTDSTNEEKRRWIMAKYDSKLFTFPLQRGESLAFLTRRTMSESEDSQEGSDMLPVRLAEAVALIGPKKPRQYAEHSQCPRLQEIDLLPGVITSMKSDDSGSGKLPDLLGHCVFPLGLHLSDVEIEPIAFSFVLTNESRMKVFGAALHFSEMLEPDELEHFVGKTTATALTNTHPVIYSPKALTVLSFYPFFHLFREVVTVLYHVSLSSSPLPLERLMCNFLKEVALPPEGVAQVVYPLPDRMLHVCRPSSNKLSMCDFSYLPLFMSLSIDNIITVFRCLCAENSVCVVSSNLSLLTPVQEALLSLLFPLQWQGCYIPVLPMHMTDVLEAPVPILVGVHSSYFQRVAERYRPARVVFVNLDENKIFLGSGTNINPDMAFASFQFNGESDHVSIPPLPKSILAKLKSKLEEHGGNYRNSPAGIERCRHLLRNSDKAFAHNEHLVPMQRFYDSTLSSVTIGTKADSQWCCTHSIKSSSITNKSDAGRKASVGPASATQKRSSTSAAAGMITGANGTGNHMLDPLNNHMVDEGFDSVEIRLAFLRVFVKLIGDYRDYVTIKGTDGDSSPRFNSEAFSASQQHEPFAKQLVETQMFCKFLEEDIEDHPEKWYFLESVTKKKNRSVLSAFKKEATPFLDNSSDLISETCRAPEPSNWGISLNQRFSYSQFPVFDMSLAGPVRPAPILVRKRQKVKQLSKAEQAVDQLLNARLKHLNGNGGSRAMHSADVSEAADGNAEMELGLESLIARYRQRNSNIERVLVRVQALFRGSRCKRRYLKQQRAVQSIQKCYRRYRGRLWWHRVRDLTMRVIRNRSKRIISKLMKKFNRQRSDVAIVMQSFCRRLLQRKKFLAIKAKVTLMQGQWRMIRDRRNFKKTVMMCIRLQQLLRGLCQRQKLKKSIARCYREQLELVLLLWEVCHVSLANRTQFWVGLTAYKASHGSIFICLGMLRQESFKYLAMMDEPLMPPRFNMDRGVVSTKYDRSKLMKINRSALTEALSKSAAWGSIQAAAEAETAERKQLYANMKKNCSPANLQKMYSALPTVIGPKKRKETLAKVVWTFGADIDKAQTSCKVVALAFPNLNLSPDAFTVTPLILARKHDIVQEACSSAAVTLLASKNTAGKQVRKSFV